MENNEIMNEGIEAVMGEVVANEGSGIKPGVVGVIVATVTALVAGGVLLWKTHKKKKELRQPDQEVLVEAEDLEDVVTE